MNFIKSIFLILLKIFYKGFNFIYFLGFKKISFFIIFFCLLLLMFWLITGTITGGWLRQFKFKKFQSLENRADEIQSFDLNDLLSFNELFPVQEYSVLLDKIVVNLKPEPNHSLPMGAFHIYLKVDSRKTAILVKRIKKKLHDQIQRSVEELNYSEIQGIEGMKKLKSTIKNTANQAIFFSKGKVNNVYFKTIVIKP